MEFALQLLVLFTKPRPSFITVATPVKLLQHMMQCTIDERALK